VDFTEAIRLDPESAEAYQYRGCAYSSKGDHDNAITDLTAAIRISPEAGVLFYARGYSYRQKNDNAKADVDFAQAEKLGYKPKSGGVPSPGEG